MNPILALSDQHSSSRGFTPTASAGVQAFSTLRLSIDEVQGLRKSIPTWAAADTPGHFFKYSDEQTIVAVQAVDRLIAEEAVDLDGGRDWGLIVAPRFIGRLAGAAIRDRFQQRGDQGVSPHTLPQHSLHSPSGALSILLGTRGPNAGIGGGPGSFAEGVLAALTLFDLNTIPGVWFVATEWDPEPLPNAQGVCTTPAVCHAFCMLLRPAASRGLIGQLALRVSKDGPAVATEHGPTKEIRVGQLIHALDIASQRSMSLGFEWQMPWGGRIEMHLDAAGDCREAAA